MCKIKQPRFIPSISDFSVPIQKKVSLYSNEKLNGFALACINGTFKKDSIHMACCAELVRRTKKNK